MAVKDIVHYGDPILRKKCSPVKDFSNLESLIDDLFDTMYEAEGIGLAANQVGLDLNLFVIHISDTDEDDIPRVFINGEILISEGKCVFPEGCLSMPLVSLEVARPETITFRYQSLDKGWEEEVFSDLLGRAIQHEMDHLNGILIIDRVSSIEKMKVNKELKEIKRNAEKKMGKRSIEKMFVL
ncbi:uncharacterized protein METZ01_LOCUS160200 [marine metagenome]|jgi:peptide deformylase|uniref:Peptide deformylase n=1 Tax=marine metagenome TaxID=408172 RepID=A0A382B0L8_9ZZZZ